MSVVAAREGSLELELGETLGEGRDGICYRVVDNNLGFPDMVVKVMFESQRALQTIRHVEQLLTNQVRRDFCQTRSLECLLLTPFISGEDRCCLLMPRAHGRTLTDQDSVRELMSLSLPERLQIACDIALGMERLHSAGIIHADIAGPNIVVDSCNLRAYIIDVDGGGLVNSLAPRIKGHHGDWMAPELQPSHSPPPSQSSDQWSLAAVLHEVITGLSPFYFCPTLQDRCKYTDRWPPTPASLPFQVRRFAEWHENTLGQVGEISALFTRTFSIGQVNPRARSTASEWARCLKLRLGELPRHTNPCPRCGTDNSAEQVYCRDEKCAAILHRCLCRCSACGQLIPIDASFCTQCGFKQP
jgi:serine/threonine protein kinase